MNVIERAIEIVEERGLTGGLPVRSNGTVCSLGALALACDVEVVGDHMSLYDVDYACSQDVRLRAAVAVLGDEYAERFGYETASTSSLYRVYMPNDMLVAEGRQDELIEAMRFAAKRLAAGEVHE